MKLFNKLKRLFSLDTEINKVQRQIQDVRQEADHIKLLLARQIIHNNKALTAKDNIQRAEFKVFSQWGDDGIIQHLLSNLDIENKTFVEFGVENYREANTRFLLINNNWSGLVIDGSKKNINQIKSDEISWRYNLKAECAFIHKDNINKIISSAGYQGEIGLLSVDIDGNDYWIWESIDVVNPVIVVAEYNSLFGSTRAITIPYQQDFVRTKAHFSNLYFGASLPALCRLAEKKNYCFIGTNSNGVNAFFVRKDAMNNFRELTIEEGYTAAKFSEARDVSGKLSYLSHMEGLHLLKGLPVINVCTNKSELI